MRTRVLAVLLVTACGGPAVVGVGPADVPADDHPLHGAWVTTLAPDGDPLPCPLIVELFADGTAEVNFISDDSDREMCTFARIPWRHDPSAMPPRLGLAGQLLSCIYKREDEYLRLACEDREEPPPDFSQSVRLRRLAVREGGGLAAMAGQWYALAFWGASGGSIVIEADGRLRADDATGRLEVHDDRRLTMHVGSARQVCIYRITERRLSLRCHHPDQGFPDGFGGPNPGLTTLVLTREAADADSALRGGEPAPRPAGRGGDRDGDGSRDSVDQCPDDPEDYDGFADEDGCPDPDNDRDGLLDVDDQCPNVPEDRDGHQDADGCPEGRSGDRDGDGILDRVDECPDDPEDRDGFEDGDGCPEPDNDQDGILDVDDLCPNDPEDRDGFEDEDGCPDPDNDRDRILDVDDSCPNDAEDYDGHQDADGCPD